MDEAEKAKQKEHGTLRKRDTRHAKRAIRKEKEVRTEEWTRRTNDIGKLHKLQPLPVEEELDGMPKPDSKPNVPAKILKPNRPRQPPEDIVPPKLSTKLKKLEGKNEQACCVIA